MYGDFPKLHWLKEWNKGVKSLCILGCRQQDKETDEAVLECAEILQQKQGGLNPAA